MRIPSLLRSALILAIAALSALPIPATAGSAPGADLGVPSGLKFLDGTTCGQYMTTEAMVSQCDSAVANHWIMLGWNFNPNACAAPPCAKPDGFQITRSAGGAASVFATQAAAPGQTTVFGTILQNIKGDENIGACFTVAPYRGTSDVGRPASSICIVQIVHLKIGPTRWGTAHSYFHYSGSCSSPSSNPFGYHLMFMDNGADTGTGIFSGYVSRLNGSCFGGYNNYDDSYQGLLYYDLSSLAGKSVSKATLSLQVYAGAYNQGDQNGGNGHESSGNTNCATSLGFPTNVNVGSDSTFPQVVKYASFATLTGFAGEADVDLTGMVRAWLSPGGINRGIVISPSLLFDGGIYFGPPNAECLSQFTEPVLDITYQ